MALFTEDQIINNPIYGRLMEDINHLHRMKGEPPVVATLDNVAIADIAKGIQFTDSVIYIGEHMEVLAGDTKNFIEYIFGLRAEVFDTMIWERSREATPALAELSSPNDHTKWLEVSQHARRALHGFEMELHADNLLGAWLSEGKQKTTLKVSELINSVNDSIRW